MGAGQGTGGGRLKHILGLDANMVGEIMDLVGGGGGGDTQHTNVRAVASVCVWIQNKSMYV